MYKIIRYCNLTRICECAKTKTECTKEIRKVKIQKCTKPFYLNKIIWHIIIAVKFHIILSFFLCRRRISFNAKTDIQNFNNFHPDGKNSTTFCFIHERTAQFQRTNNCFFFFRILHVYFPGTQMNAPRRLTTNNIII